MMKITVILPFLISLSFIFDTQVTQGQEAKSFIIKGKIDTISNVQYPIFYSENKIEVWDSIKLDERSEFTYTAKIKEPTRLNFVILNNFNPQLVPTQLVYTLWVQPGEIIDFRGHRNWLKGSKDNLYINPYQYSAQGAKLNESEFSRNKEREKAINDYEKATQRKINAGERSRILDSLDDKFIEEHPNNFISLYLLQSRLKGKDNLAKITAQYVSLSPALQQSPTGKFIDRKLKILPNLDIGKILPDFEVTDINGKQVKLSDFRGKYVLVDFWASWCAPCRKEFPFLRELYKNHHMQAFDILGVSIDESVEEWKKASQEESLIWTNTCSPGDLNSELYRLFNLNGVPDNFLLDPDGKIIARNLRAENLKTTLEQIFNAKQLSKR